EKSERTATQLSQEIVKSAEVGIIVYDTELRYVLFNPFMERLTGRRSEEVLGREAAEVFPRLRTSGIEGLLKRALRGETAHMPDVLVPRHSSNGCDVWESCTFAPCVDQQGSTVGVLGLVRDVTERHLEEDRFKSIVVGTASATGKDFFPTLVRHMATALGTRYAFISDCADQKRAKVLAVWTGDRFGELLEFDIADTPCMKVLNGEVCHYK